MERKLEPEVMDSADEAIAYDQMDNSQPNAAFVGRLLELGASGRMLDIGTGPGHIPVAVCQAIGDSKVFGVDLSKQMLKVARAHQHASGLGDRIEYHYMDAKDLAFEDASFDVVFSNTILHHIPEPLPFLSEAWRVLRPGGVLLIRDLFRPPDQATLDALVAEHTVGETEYLRQMFADSLRAALTPDELQQIVDELGMQGVELVIDSDRHISIQTRSAVK